MPTVSMPSVSSASGSGAQASADSVALAAGSRGRPVLVVVAAGGDGQRQQADQEREQEAGQREILSERVERLRILPRAQRTSRSTRRSSSPSGSSLRPVWTGEHWMIVLDGATSQWKRSEAGSAAIGPAAGLARRDRARARRGARGRRRGRRRARARARAPRRARRARRGSAAGGRTARRRRSRTRRARPRGTTRTIAYWNGLGGTARLLGLGGEAARRLQPPAQVLGVGARGRAARTSRRARARDALATSTSQPRREPLAGLGDVARARQQHVVADRRERALRLGRRVLPGVLEVERRAVVDQPDAAVPEQQVRVLRRAVDVRRQRVEPDDVGGELRVGRRRRRRGCR